MSNDKIIETLATNMKIILDLHIASSNARNTVDQLKDEINQQKKEILEMKTKLKNLESVNDRLEALEMAVKYNEVETEIVMNLSPKPANTNQRESLPGWNIHSSDSLGSVPPDALHHFLPLTPVIHPPNDD